MKRKTSNILIGILAAVIVFCGVMAAGTFNGWFSGDKSQTVSEGTVAAEETATSEAASESVQEEVQAEENQAETKQQVQTQKPAEEKPAATQAETQTTKAASRCTITIKCDSILKHLDDLDDGKSKYVPSNGVILSKSTVEFRDGNTVYDVLNAACSAAGINLSARSSSMGIYVEGINNIFEFDCGKTSGWMYSVNGTSPNHSCSEHKVKNGDSIVWYYTCGK